MDPVKGAVGAGVGVLAIGGGYGVSTLFKVPDASSLEKFLGSNSSQSSTYPNDKFGWKNKAKLIAAFDSGNQKRWEYIYDKILKPMQTASDATTQLNSIFQSTAVTKGYAASSSETGAANALNKVCDDQYKENDPTETTKKSNIWKFCSFDGVVPATVSAG
ncbi:hypothetical protein [Candidatus Mycoplasma haematohominis]|uniref:Uncharacterized protein n=1 Tax=Candidatus Mycoplasma haematohominis TaxID=1494318 RepID=A0A478FQN6_9MOLU|nr:hypothetical protein [Candidatus Mycoplasma haemohominis]GCE63783.1 hypothetical protein MHSWG343_07900 [Candidatus Mycoplasma haemohominis]